MGIKIKKKSDNQEPVKPIAKKQVVKATDAPVSPIKKSMATKKPLSKGAVNTANQIAGKTKEQGKAENQVHQDAVTHTKNLGKGTVIVEGKKGEILSESTELVEAVISTEPQANVGMNMGLTVNLGDFNNVKFNVSLYLPCANNDAAIEKTFRKVSTWVDSKVNEINDTVTASQEE